jgi:hypothetical protein
VLGVAVEDVAARQRRQPVELQPRSLEIDRRSAFQAQAPLDRDDPREWAR